MSSASSLAAGSSGSAPSGPAGNGSNGNDDDFSTDQVTVFSHEGDGENTEHLNSMDLHDVKTALKICAENAETPKTAAGSPTGQSSIATTSSGLAAASIRPILPHTMVYTNGTGMPFVVPPFAAGTPIYPVMRPLKVEGSEWPKGQSSIAGIPAYSYAAAGFLPVDQSSGLRPATAAAYPFMIPGQYVAAPYQHPQFNTTFGQPVAPNAAVQPNSGIVTTVPQKEKKPHIKKPLNAFMLFMKEKRAEVIKECTLKESAAINQILGKKWHALDRSEQAKYYEMAREERQRHMQMYPGWSARDNYAIHKRRKKRKVKQGGAGGPVGSDGSASPTKQHPNNVAAAVGGGGVVSMTSSLSGGGSASGESEMCILEEEDDGSERMDGDAGGARKCRARYGLEKQNLWCGPCRRKKKCVRYSEDDEDGAPKVFHGELDDDVIAKNSNTTAIVSSGGVSETFGDSKTTLQASHSGIAHQATPTTVRPEQRLINAPITLQTIPT